MNKNFKNNNRLLKSLEIFLLASKVRELSYSPIPINYKRKDFQSDQEVKWCPGCGDYTLLASVQSFMAEMGISKEKIVFVSGIGCAARFPY